MTQSHFKSSTLIKVALYQPDIPQNTAAIVRLCACFGARLDIIEPCGFFLSDKRFKRVVMDYINKCKIKSFKDFAEFKKDVADHHELGWENLTEEYFNSLEDMNDAGNGVLEDEAFGENRRDYWKYFHSLLDKHTDLGIYRNFLPANKR